MRALTLWQPWAHLVANGEKLIENRPWEPPDWIIDKRFAIHAGLRWDRDSAILAAALGGVELAKEDVVRGAVIGVAKVITSVTDEATAEACVPGHGKWFFGPYGWVLEDVQILSTPIPCRGYQKLWNLSEDVEAKVLEQLGS